MPSAFSHRHDWASVLRNFDFVTCQIHVRLFASDILDIGLYAYKVTDTHLSPKAINHTLNINIYSFLLSFALQGVCKILLRSWATVSPLQKYDVTD